MVGVYSATLLNSYEISLFINKPVSELYHASKRDVKSQDNASGQFQILFAVSVLRLNYNINYPILSVEETTTVNLKRIGLYEEFNSLLYLKHKIQLVRFIRIPRIEITFHRYIIMLLKRVFLQRNESQGVQLFPGYCIIHHYSVRQEYLT